MSAGFGPIRQLGYVVADLAASVQQWHRSQGFGRWVCFRNVTMAGEYRGRPATLTMHVALAYRDELEIELIEPVSRIASPYLDAAGRPAVGPNHLAWFSSGLEADLARARGTGLEVVYVGHNPVTRIAYLEPPAEPQVRYELIEYTAQGLEGWSERMRAARAAGDALSIVEIDLANLP
ncbi:MAG TPA: VOC family protein [Steroidobacteraceae bacterium]|nr:VOC family protein [Steroidobacteraceae bacterium]